MVNHGSGWVRMEFTIPSRGLIGLRGQPCLRTRAARAQLQAPCLKVGAEYGGEMASRPTGALVASIARGSTTGLCAMANLQDAVNAVRRAGTRFTKA